MDFTGFTVINLGALANVDAHRENGILFNDSTFNYFRWGGTKAALFTNE
jgi:hypothetical protein